MKTHQSHKQQTYERVKRYMTANTGWVTPAMVERDFITETPARIAPEARAIAVALRTLVAEGLCERTGTGFSYGLAQFKYRRREPQP